MHVIRGRRGWLESVCALSLLLSVLACPGPQKGLKETPAEYDLPLDGSSFDLAAFNKFLSDYKPGDLHKYNRDAKTCKKCVEVEIQSVGLTTDIDDKKAPAKARVVAALRNIDKNNSEDMYGIEPRDKADYYLWIPGAASGPTQWIVVGLEKQSGGQAVAHLGKRGLFKRCDYQGSDKISEADFKSCEKAHPPGGINKSEILGDTWLGFVRAALGRILQTGDTTRPIGEDPAWLRCANGCCTASIT